MCLGGRHQACKSILRLQAEDRDLFSPSTRLQLFKASMFNNVSVATGCGVKELIMSNACKCCNHVDHVSDDLSE